MKREQSSARHRISPEVTRRGGKILFVGCQESRRRKPLKEAADGL